MPIEYDKANLIGVINSAVNDFFFESIGAVSAQDLRAATRAYAMTIGRISAVFDDRLETADDPLVFIAETESAMVSAVFSRIEQDKKSGGIIREAMQASSPKKR
ncbi:hypothetical protein D3X12_24055 [Pseudomonas protegens]|jgi:hypothetical protein|uniref:Uncharacterized protein n=2 Tax=Pseudomonas protegens TaxID=380021 RepID=F9XXC7_PSEF5|nr:hypothetical protein [Pseudomonas protegens]AEK81719.1 Hypothetical protein PFL_6276 [Pseudomonas protegens Pf-5]ASE22806.1 hypothetical protein CEP86_20875 [Pseudomonas protegens]MDS9879279.1 hypothetical protein [Pseudomonas protegens]QEZ53506.1 hypothetical protein D3X12_24055 [Pseudomonas protegens]QEZ60287.1 hypothetical protein D4N38_27755 [Pseudomonas protegens]